MAYLSPQTTSTFERNRLFLLGQGPSPEPDPGAPIPLSSAPAEGGGQPLETTQASAPAPTQELGTPQADNPRTTQQEAAGPPRAGAVDLYDEGAAGGAGAFLNPFGSAGREQETDIYGLSSDFHEEAGPMKGGWGGVGGAGTIETALDPDAGQEGRPSLDERTQAQAKTREHVNAIYGGPSALDPSGVATVRDKQSQLESQAGALRTGAGIAGTLQANTPGLTPGMARYDAQEMIRQGVPNQVVRDINPELRRIGATLGTEARGAEEFAKARAAEEEEIRTSARSALGDARSKVYGEVDQAVLQAQTRDANLQAAFDAWRADPTGANWDAVQALQPDLAESEPWETPGTRLLEEGKAERERIMSDPRFAAIADIAPLELTINKRGREKFSLAGDESDRELWGEVKGKNLTREQFLLLKERQAMLEAGFSPGSKKSGEGEFSNVMPLYFDDELGEWVPTDPTSYAGIDPGVMPTRDNVATEDQRYVVNMASDLLNEAQRLDEAGQPLRAAMVFAQGQKYLEDEARALEERKGTLDEREKAHLKAVNKARKNYKKVQHQKPYAKVAKISLPGVSIGGTHVTEGMTRKFSDVVN